jgi:hypothetical protein
MMPYRSTECTHLLLDESHSKVHPFGKQKRTDTNRAARASQRLGIRKPSPSRANAGPPKENVDMPTSSQPPSSEQDAQKGRNSGQAHRSRRWALGAIAVSAVGAGRLLPVFAQDEDDETTEAEDIEAPIQPNTVGELPTTGALRPGPIGMEPPALAPVQATQPTTIVIEQAGVDAEIETLHIVDGVMQNPTGPWVVSWYQETAELGSRGNVVLAGHINYWNVGDAVFANLADLTQGAEAVVSGEDNRPYRYAVEWVETFEVAELTSGTIQDVVGPTAESALTLITCGGEFDYASGEYLSRTVARALLIEE